MVAGNQRIGVGNRDPRNFRLFQIVARDQRINISIASQYHQRLFFHQIRHRGFRGIHIGLIIRVNQLHFFPQDFRIKFIRQFDPFHLQTSSFFVGTAHRLVNADPDRVIRLRIFIDKRFFKIVKRGASRQRQTTYRRSQKPRNPSSRHFHTLISYSLNASPMIISPVYAFLT